jgi:SAM-dependent methyltransferase
VKLDLGCGKNKKADHVGVDVRQFDGVDVVCDLGTEAWPWEAGSIDEVYCSHMIEHLTWPQRVHFFNELGRVLKKGAKAQIILPHWNSSRFYGDPTHQAPMSEFAFYYLLASWRDANAPHTDYVCDFDATWGYSTHPALHSRNVEYQQYAIQWFKEACQDVIATLVKR